MMGLRRRGALGECDARTQGAHVSAVIRARVRTRQRAAQRGPAAQRFIVKGVLRPVAVLLVAAATLAGAPPATADLADETALAERHTPVIRIAEQLEEWARGALQADQRRAALRRAHRLAARAVEPGRPDRDRTGGRRPRGSLRIPPRLPGNALDPGCAYERWERRLRREARRRSTPTSQPMRISRDSSRSSTGFSTRTTTGTTCTKGTGRCPAPLRRGRCGRGAQGRAGRGRLQPARGGRARRLGRREARARRRAQAGRLSSRGLSRELLHPRTPRRKLGRAGRWLRRHARAAHRDRPSGGGDPERPVGGRGRPPVDLVRGQLGRAPGRVLQRSHRAESEVPGPSRSSVRGLAATELRRADRRCLRNRGDGLLLRSRWQGLRALDGSCDARCALLIVVAASACGLPGVLATWLPSRPSAWRAARLGPDAVSVGAMYFRARRSSSGSGFSSSRSPPSSRSSRRSPRRPRAPRDRGDRCVAGRSRPRRRRDRDDAYPARARARPGGHVAAVVGRRGPQRSVRSDAYRTRSGEFGRCWRRPRRRGLVRARVSAPPSGGGLARGSLGAAGAGRGARRPRRGRGASGGAPSSCANAGCGSHRSWRRGHPRLRGRAAPRRAPDPLHDNPSPLLNVVAGVVYAFALPFVAVTTCYVYFDAGAGSSSSGRRTSSSALPRSASASAPSEAAPGCAGAISRPPRRRPRCASGPRGRRTSRPGSHQPPLGVVLHLVRFTRADEHGTRQAVRSCETGPSAWTSPRRLERGRVVLLEDPRPSGSGKR